MKHRNPRQRPQASGSLGALGNDLHRFHARHPAKAFTAHLLSGLLVCLVSWVGGATEPVAVFECRDHLARDWPRTLVTYEKQFPEGAMVGAFGQQVEKGIAPGRIQGVRLVDGRWIGGSYFFAAKPDTAPKVTRYTCRITEQGPLFAEAVVRYTFSQGGWYELTALVINGRTYAPGPSGETLIIPLLPGEHRLEVRALDQPPVFLNWHAS